MFWRFRTLTCSTTFTKFFYAASMSNVTFSASVPTLNKKTLSTKVLRKFPLDTISFETLTSSTTFTKTKTTLKISTFYQSEESLVRTLFIFSTTLMFSTTFSTFFCTSMSKTSEFNVSFWNLRTSSCSSILSGIRYATTNISFASSTKRNGT